MFIFVVGVLLAQILISAIIRRGSEQNSFAGRYEMASSVLVVIVIWVLRLVLILLPVFTDTTVDTQISHLIGVFIILIGFVVWIVSVK